MNNILRSIVIFIYICYFTLPIYACVGARPLGMGGAFVAVADDINSVYWNPAGLAYLKGNVATFTIDTDKYDSKQFKSSYPYYFAAGFGTENNYWALSYTKVAEGYQDTGRGKSWLYAATGKMINDRFSIGLDLGYREVKEPYFNLTENHDEIAAHLPIFFDVGLLYKWDYNINFGLLIQGIKNLRPGISIKPVDNLIICFEDYDVLDNFDEHALHWGIEYKLVENIALRYGWYWAHTYGIGYTYDSLSFDVFAWQSSEDPNLMHTVGYAVTINF